MATDIRGYEMTTLLPVPPSSVSLPSLASAEPLLSER
jgi:hypothetical protein